MSKVKTSAFFAPTMSTAVPNKTLQEGSNQRQKTNKQKIAICTQNKARKKSCTSLEALTKKNCQEGMMVSLHTWYLISKISRNLQNHKPQGWGTKFWNEGQWDLRLSSWQTFQHTRWNFWSPPPKKKRKKKNGDCCGENFVMTKASAWSQTWRPFFFSPHFLFSMIFFVHLCFSLQSNSNSNP